MFLPVSTKLGILTGSTLGVVVGGCWMPPLLGNWVFTFDLKYLQSCILHFFSSWWRWSRRIRIPRYKDRFSGPNRTSANDSTVRASARRISARFPLQFPYCDHISLFVFKLKTNSKLINFSIIWIWKHLQHSLDLENSLWLTRQCRSFKNLFTRPVLQLLLSLLHHLRLTWFAERILFDIIRKLSIFNIWN